MAEGSTGWKTPEMNPFTFAEGSPSAVNSSGTTSQQPGQPGTPEFDISELVGGDDEWEKRTRCEAGVVGGSGTFDEAPGPPKAGSGQKRNAPHEADSISSKDSDAESEVKKPKRV